MQHLPIVYRQIAPSNVLDLIRTERYFVLHAPRQTGKTSALLALRDLLNRGGEGDYRCVYVNVEPAQAMREDVETAMRAILGALASWARTTLGDGFLDEAWPGILAKHGPAGALGEALARWSEADAKPLVLLVDEIDALVGDTLLSVLRQLRAGYVRRPAGFPQSVVLCGVRDVRDYRIRSGAEKAVEGGDCRGQRLQRQGPFNAPGRLLPRRRDGFAGAAWRLTGGIRANPFVFRTRNLPNTRRRGI